MYSQTDHKFQKNGVFYFSIAVKMNGQIWFLFSFEVLVITGLEKKKAGDAYVRTEHIQAVSKIDTSCQGTLDLFNCTKKYRRFDALNPYFICILFIKYR